MQTFQASKRLILGFLLIFLVYRVALLITMLDLNLDPHLFTFIIITFGLTQDVLVSGIILAVYALVFYSLSFCPAATQIKLRFSQFFYASLAVIISVILIINLSLAHERFIGLNYPIIYTLWQQKQDWLKFIGFINTYHYYLIAALALASLLPYWLSNKYLNNSLRVICLVYALLITFSATNLRHLQLNKPNLRFHAMLNNPLLILAQEAYRSRQAYQFHSAPLTPINNTVKQIYQPILTALPYRHNNQFNIVIIVLESIGKDYISNTTMPFLSKLAMQGAWYENNYTGGNLSAYGQWSIFTGLYPYLLPNHAEMQNHAKIKIISDYLPGYDSFLVSASSDLYFSPAVNHRFKTYANANICAKTSDLKFNMFADENQSLAYFINQLKRHQRTPYLGVYWANAAHYPYYNYFNNFTTSSPSLNSYQMSLAFADYEIKTIFKYLQNSQQLDNTIFIVVGDHGEMFGQHAGIYVHGRSLYQPEIKVPLFIYAKKLLPAQTIHSITSSVDLFPTLMSLLKLPSVPSQGVSHLQPYATRTIYVYSDQFALAGINIHHKMLVSFVDNSCQQFDKTDAREIHPQTCNDFNLEQQIINFQHQQADYLRQFD